jgi:hypothetical protein
MGLVLVGIVVALFVIAAVAWRDFSHVCERVCQRWDER